MENLNLVASTKIKYGVEVKFVRNGNPKRLTIFLGVGGLSTKFDFKAPKEYFYFIPTVHLIKVSPLPFYKSPTRNTTKTPEASSRDL